MKFRPTTDATLEKDLRAFAKWLKDAPVGDRAVAVTAFNSMLDDEFLTEDSFGTEGQCDPRGDHRE